MNVRDTLILFPLALGCGNPPSPVSPLAEAEVKCVATRTAKQIFCSAQFSNRLEIDACIAGVQAALDCTDGGVAVTSSEGGK